MNRGSGQSEGQSGRRGAKFKFGVDQVDAKRMIIFLGTFNWGKCDENATRSRNVVGARQQQQKQRHARSGYLKNCWKSRPMRTDERPRRPQRGDGNIFTAVRPVVGFSSGDKMADKHVIITSHTHQARRRRISNLV